MRMPSDGNLTGIKLSIQETEPDTNLVTHEPNTNLVTHEQPQPEEADISEFIPTPPDGGWGWVIVFASFMNHFILDGICYAFSQFLLDYKEIFNTNQASTGALMSTLIGMYLLSAPIASALVNRFGCRTVGMCGSVLAAAAFLLSTLSRSITAMILSLGVIAGFGFGMMYLPAVISVSLYFEKKRALATGIAMCGTGFGTFTFGPVARALIDEFGWQGTHYIMAGIVLQGVIFSALIKPLKSKREIQEDWYRKQEKKTPGIARDKNVNCNSNGVKTHSSQPNILRKSSVELGSVKLHRSVAYLGGPSTSPITLTIEEAHDLKRPLYKKDIFYSGSVHNLPEYKEQATVEDYVTSITSLPVMKEDSIKHTYLCCCKCLPRQMKDVLNEMLDLSLFKSPSFNIIIVAVLIIMLAYFIPFAYCAPRAISLGLDDQKASYVVSILGISTMCGRLGSAVLAQIPHLRPIIVHNVFLLLSGVSCALTPLCKDFITICISAFCYGLFMGGHVSLSPIVLVDIIGLNRLTSAYGLITLVRGISTLVGAPLGGFIFDKTGTYDSVFYMAGSLIMLSTAGFIIIDLQCIKRREHLFKLQPESHEMKTIKLRVSDAPLQNAAKT